MRFLIALFLEFNMMGIPCIFSYTWKFSNNLFVQEMKRRLQELTAARSVKTLFLFQPVRGQRFFGILLLNKGLRIFPINCVRNRAKKSIKWEKVCILF